MKNIVLIFVFLFLASCTHKSIVQLGEGERTEKTVQSCVHNIFAFPLKAEDGTTDGLLQKYSLSPKDVYSVDKHTWYYLFPIYFNYCHVARLNKQGEQIYLKYAPADVKPVEFSDLKDVKECEQFRALRRDNCVHYFLHKK